MKKSNEELRTILLELEALELERDRRRGKSDIVFFAQRFLPHLLKCATPAFHREIYDLLKTHARVALAAPRSFAKSTVTDIIYALHCLLYGTREDIILLSNSGALAVDMIRKVKMELENNQAIVQAFTPQQSDKWTEEHIILKNGNQIRGKGYGYQIRGFRPTRVICDDLEDDELVRSKDRRDKLFEWFTGALINTLEPDQQLVYIGTLLHPLSLLKRIITEDDPLFSKWTRRLYMAYVNRERTQSLWPEKWSIEALKTRESEIGTHQFEAEFMNNPLADNQVVFHPDTYRWYEELPECDLTITGFDLIASTKEFEGKDYIAFVTLGREKVGGKIYCIDARHGRWTQEEVLEQFVDINTVFHPTAFVGEEVSFQQIVNENLTRLAREQKVYLPIQGIKLGSYSDKDPLKKAKDKVSRALKVQHVFTQGLFHLRHGQRELLEELSTFPASDYDDLIDAMVHALHVLTERIPIEIMEPNKPLDFGSAPLSTVLPKNRFAKDGILLADKRGPF